jgi:hypothetical protein
LGPVTDLQEKKMYGAFEKKRNKKKRYRNGICSAFGDSYWIEECLRILPLVAQHDRIATEFVFTTSPLQNNMACRLV